jgi:glycine/D-amino acid oxidase-like deaminating enzyme
MTYDALVVGAGHNGLVTACYLARAGLKVAVIEKNDWIGGAAVFKRGGGYLATFRNHDANRRELAGHSPRDAPTSASY